MLFSVSAVFFILPLNCHCEERSNLICCSMCDGAPSAMGNRDKKTSTSGDSSSNTNCLDVLVQYFYVKLSLSTRLKTS